MNTLAKKWEDIFSLILKKAPPEGLSESLGEAISLLGEIRRACTKDRPELIPKLDEVVAAFDTRQSKAIRLRKLREFFEAARSSDLQPLEQQQAALARVRAEPMRAFTGDPLLNAETVNQILDEDTISGEELSDCFDCSAQTILDKHKKNQLLALQGAKRGLRYPRWQCEPKLWKQLPDVLKLLAGEDPWDVFAFLQGSYPALDGRTPLDMLREGKKQKVMEFARDFFALESETS